MPRGLSSLLASHVVGVVRIAAIDDDVSGLEHRLSVCSNESTAAAGIIIHTTRGTGSFATRSVTEAAGVAPSAASALTAGILKSNATH